MMKPARFHIATLLALALVGAPVAHAQQTSLPATLIADNIGFDGGTESILASGLVEVFFDGARLTATSIRYDGRSDQIAVQGPLTLTDATGRTIIFADFAELSTDLQDGVLRSARLVLDRQLQIAATEISRTDGRYTQLYQSVASSCEVCADNPVPLWEIRARRVVHDQEEQQLYFEDAQFRAFGVPIAYLPRLRLPDPTLERATGFLVPEIRANDQIGTGVRIPYFIEMGQHSDLTLTPYLTAGTSQTLEARYRRAFTHGYVEANGAISRDNLTDDAMRSYLFVEGQFMLPQDFRLDFDFETTSDSTYLLTYGYSEEDRLDSSARISRARRDEYIGVGLTGYHSLRSSDNNQTQPTLVSDAEIVRRYAPDVLGGIATLSFSTHSQRRNSEVDIDGRDVGRITALAEWRRDWVLPLGLLGAVETAWQGDVYRVTQDSTFDEYITRSTPFVAAELRWPLARTTARGVTHVIEPAMQLVWSPETGEPVPNEDSVVVEFDEGNLFSLNRFTGLDGQEAGTRLALGLTYTRDDPLGWSLGVTAGKVIRDGDRNQFTPGSGLDGSRSDWLIATHVAIGDGLSLMNRALFDDDFAVSSNELALQWSSDNYVVGSSLTVLQSDIQEGRPDDMAEWALDASYDFDNAWAAAVDWRYDFEASAPTRAGMRVTYATECIDVALSVSRRYTTSTNLTPATDFGLRVALNGFGASRDGRRYDRSCR